MNKPASVRSCRKPWLAMRREQGACHKVPCYGACGPAEDTPAGRACPPTMNLTSGSGFFDITRRPRPVCFSNRPFGVKRFQTTHHHSVDVARGLVLLFGIGTKALPSWDSKIRWNNLPGGLAVKLTVGPSGHANSPHPSSREGHHSTVWVEFEFSSMLLPWPVPGSTGTRRRALRQEPGS